MAASSGKTALVILAEGAEEMEAVITVDVLRRGGIEVTLANLDGSVGPVACSRNVKIVPDCTLEDAKGPFDAVILPGGLGGAERLAKSGTVGTILKDQEAAGRLVAAVCAAPTALKAHQVGQGKMATSYPSFKEKLSDFFQYSEDRVVVDGNLITSRGPGTCFEFAEAIVAKLVNEETAKKNSKAMLVK